MKFLLIGLIILLCFSIKQPDTIKNKKDCGSWIIDTAYYTNWRNYDTINSIHNKESNIMYQFEWIYSRFTPIQIEQVRCICGCGYPHKWEQRRLSKITGIVQRREKIQLYKYIPK